MKNFFKALPAFLILVSLIGAAILVNGDSSAAEEVMAAYGAQTEAIDEEERLTREIIELNKEISETQRELDNAEKLPPPDDYLIWQKRNEYVKQYLN